MSTTDRQPRQSQPQPVVAPPRRVRHDLYTSCRKWIEIPPGLGPAASAAYCRWANLLGRLDPRAATPRDVAAMLGEYEAARAEHGFPAIRPGGLIGAKAGGRR